MRITFLAGVVLAATLVSAQNPPKTTTKECRAELKQWVPMFKVAYADPACTGDGSASCPFVSSLRDLDIGQLMRLPFQAEACAKVDKRRRYRYEQAAVRAENIVVMRTGYFFEATNQMDKYVDWEREQRQVSSPTTKPDDPPTVANNR